jgi:hypothetical protein
MPDQPSNSGSSDLLRALGADLSTHPSVLSERERELLASLVAQLKTQTTDPNVGNAIHTALSNTLGKRASDVLGAAIASHLLGAGGRVPAQVNPAVGPVVAHPVAPVVSEPGIFGPIAPSPIGPVANDPSGGPWVWPPLNPPPLFPPSIPPVPPNPGPGPVPVPIPIPVDPQPVPVPGVPPWFPIPVPPSLPPDDPFFPHGPQPIFPPIPLGDPGVPPPPEPIDPGDPQPIDPGWPGDPQPGEPGNPEPVDPGEPGPVGPVGPGDPGPVGPGEPTGPINPGPVDPGGPGPADPGSPGDPGPVDPGPSDPGSPEPGPSDPEGRWNGVLDPGALESIIDQFASMAVLQQVAGAVAAAGARFETQVVYTRSIEASETLAPAPVRIQVLRDAPQIDKLLVGPVERALPGAARRLAPRARQVGRIRVSVLALQPGTSTRVDLANQPAHANDVVLVATLGSTGTGTANASLRMLRGPLRLAGVDPRRGQIVVPLSTGRAVVVPALRPAEIVAPVGPNARPLLVAVVLAELSVK